MARKKQTAPKSTEAVTMVEVYKKDAKRIARVKLDNDYRYTRDVVSDILDASEKAPRKAVAA